MRKIANLYKKKIRNPREAAGNSNGHQASSSQSTTTKGTSSPSGTLEYNPLVSSNHEIRLLSFLPQTSTDGLIHLELSHYALTQPNASAELKNRFVSVSGDYFWDSNEKSKKPRFQIKPVTNTSSRFRTTAVPGRFAWGDYVALSYTWGDPYDTRRIIVNKISVDVTKNLEKALRILWEKLPMRTGMKVWVDAVCVNQQDNKEKSEQVPRMREIYKKAFDVVVWLGDDDENGQPDLESWKAMTLIRMLAASWRHDEGRYLKQSYGEEGFSLDMLFPDDRPSIGGCWHALRTLLRRPYWDRSWIIQEIFMGDRESPVLCGDEMVQFGELSDATTQWLNYSTLDLERKEMIKERLDQGAVKRSLLDPTRPLQSRTFHEAAIELGGLPYDPKLTDVGVGFYDSMAISAWTLDSERIQFMKRLRDSLGEEINAHPVNIVALGRLSDATMPHDKVYAFLGLMDPDFASLVIPDYEKSYGDVYTDFSVTWLMQNQNHNILTHCVYDENQAFPSWVPDWNKKSFQTLLPVGDVSNPYSAGGNTMGETTITQDKKVMTVLGFEFGAIDGLSMISEESNENTTTLIQPSTKGEAYADYKDALWRTFLGNRDLKFGVPNPNNGYGSEFRALLDIPLPDLGGHLPPPYDAAFYGFVKKNDTFRISGKRLDHYFANDGRREQVSTDEGSQRIFKRVLGDSVARSSMMISSRRLFTTAEGYIGLAPKAARKGDMICVVIGCSEPLLLRLQTETGKFTVLGSCYLHGIMEGELMPGVLAGQIALSPLPLC